MSKQYLTLSTLPDAHPNDVFSLAPTTDRLISASGSSTLRVHDTSQTDGFPIAQELQKAHTLGCHHVVADPGGRRLVSVGFEGKAKVWQYGEKGWKQEGEIEDSKKTGEIWAVALTEEGRYLAGTTKDGRINVWDLDSDGFQKFREYETKGSFGMCVDISQDGEHTASGHSAGTIHIFNNSTSRLIHTPRGHVKPIRSVKFSPHNSLLACAGDSRIISLYSVSSGEQVATLSGHGAWIMSLGWNMTGEYLLSGAFDGKVKIWSTETRTCVATQSEGEGKPVWTVAWLPKVLGRSEMFAVGSAGGSLSFYREASGG